MSDDLAAFLVRVEWQHLGACRGVDPHLFYPERGDPADTAKAVCAGCPVRAECLEFALTSGERFGVWGGLSEKERRRLRKQRNAGTAVSRRAPIRHGTDAGYKAHWERDEDACDACKAAHSRAVAAASRQRGDSNHHRKAS